ncbi:MAG: 50S ribosomal protein L18 [Acidimicrobiia bacterium]|nr:50S ribosomal protein L18 [Acidimicrobiia bacterium]
MRGSRADARRRRHLRVRKTLRGTGARPRLAVFRSNRYIYAQLIDDDTGATIASASSRESGLAARSLNLETATEVGKLIAGRAADAGVSTVVFDRGGFAFHGRVKALADGARQAGLEF